MEIKNKQNACVCMDGWAGGRPYFGKRQTKQWIFFPRKNTSKRKTSPTVEFLEFHVYVPVCSRRPTNKWVRRWSWRKSSHSIFRRRKRRDRDVCRCAYFGKSLFISHISIRHSPISFYFINTIFPVVVMTNTKSVAVVAHTHYSF